MKIGFIHRDRMRLEFQADAEREVLHRLLEDAGRGGDPVILAQFESDEEQEDWEDFIKPELAAEFTGQIEQVVKDLEGDPELIEIEREHFDLWFGALNQARLALEARYHFAGVDEVDKVLEWEEEKQGAFMRFQLALAIQGALLEAMDFPYRNSGEGETGDE